MSYNDKLSVIIGSCDKYNLLWKNFQICFNKYWKHNTRNIFVTETQIVPQYTNTKFETILSNKQHWGERMLYGIKSCNTKYILFLLEDYFFDYEYSSGQLNEYIEIMNTYNIDRLQISPSDFQSYIPDIGKKYLRFSPNSPYSISMQPSIWNQTFLQDVLDPEYSPWDFEIHGSEKTNQKNYSIFVDSTIPNVYFNAVRRGFIKNDGWEEFRIKHNLEDFHA